MLFVLVIIKAWYIIAKIHAPCYLVKFILVHFESSRSEKSWMLGDSEKKSTGDPVLCFFQGSGCKTSTKCFLLCLFHSREIVSLGLSGRRVIFEDRGGNAYGTEGRGSILPKFERRNYILTYE